MIKLFLFQVVHFFLEEPQREIQIFYICYPAFIRDVSSAGLEHYLDRVGVTGSNPVHPTKGKGVWRL
jgi:hypothetical protein